MPVGAKSMHPEGGSNINKVHICRKKPIKINPNFQKPDIQVKPLSNAQRKYYCCMCGNDYPTQRDNFMRCGSSLLWKGNNGYIPICKPCCEILMGSLTSFYAGNEEHALRHLCIIFDFYYDELASSMTISKSPTERERITKYPSKVNARQVAIRGDSFLDTIRDEVAEAERITDEDVLDGQEGTEEVFNVTKEMVRKWGKGFQPDQYQFLEEEYADWVNKNVCNTKAQEVIFKDLSLAQLDVRIARQTGGDVGKAQKMVQDLMNSANILPKQTADNLLADTQTFGTLLKKFEDTEPIPEPSEEWKDVDGIRKYMNTWFRGGLAKALRIQNENAMLYDEATAEMDKYTVKPSVANEVSGGNDASIFDVAIGGNNDE